MRRIALTALLVIAVAGLSACTTYQSTCLDSHCTYSLSGEQKVDVDLGTVKRSLSVGPIEPDAVTVSTSTDKARLTTGESASVAGLRVTLTSLHGKDVGLDIVPG